MHQEKKSKLTLLCMEYHFQLPLRLSFPYCMVNLWFLMLRLYTNKHETKMVLIGYHNGSLSAKLESKTNLGAE